MSKKINCYAVIDWETGGLSSLKNPVCEFAGLGINGITLEEILRYDNVVKPYDKSLLYEDGAMRVHGLTAEVCERDGVPLRQLVDDICAFAMECNVFKSKIAPPIIVGHNVVFDIPFLENVFKRANVDISQFFATYENHKGERVLHYIDTMLLTKGADAHRDDKLKYSLEESTRRHGGDLVDSHRAMNDVIATAGLFRSFWAKLRSDGGMVQASDGSGAVRKTFEI